jgi:purine-binding chemotaxis protein CheW
MAEAAKARAGEVLLVVFHLGRSEFAAPIAQVLEIIRIPGLTRMPRAPHFVAGVMNLRGKVFPVVSLRRRFAMEEIEPGPQARVMVVEAQGQVLGLLVDDVMEVLRVPSAAFEPPPAMISESVGPSLCGVVRSGERILLMLDLDMLFGLEESQELLRTAQEGEEPHA